MPGEEETVDKKAETEIQNKEGLFKMPRASANLFLFFLPSLLASQELKEPVVRVLHPERKSLGKNKIFPRTDF